LAEADQRFRAAYSAWQAEKAKTEESNRRSLDQYEHQLADWETRKASWLEEQRKRNASKDEKQASYLRSDPRAIEEYCEMVLNASEYPAEFPSAFELDYIAETRILVVDYSLPTIQALPSVKAYRYIATRDEIQPVAVAESWLNRTYDSVLYQISLRTLYELFQSDAANALDAAVFNGWVNSIDNATGKEVNACVLTIQANKAEFLEINLAQVEPKACFRKLKGISAAKLTALSPVRPILQLNKEDKRFIQPYNVVETLDSSSNLAAMDWEDFEHLIREVFEKEFSTEGGEVKITQASRDGGVDAVVFDPDPIRGGKIIIQAKRYTNTVGVSAVRDLFGTIHNEGANKGILVTTADYGPDAYEFARGKPITLLSGSELLYLLQKHGHKARIDLAEARFLAAEREKAEGKTPSG
jgi:restriction system protein